jgi:cardiolipin synthase (CMP-forming)
MRYWDFSLPSAEVHPTTVSKYNTFLQLILLGATTALPLVSADSHHLYLGGLAPAIEGADIGTAMTAFQILVAGTTAWSGMSYAFLKNAVRILGEDEELKRKQGMRGRAIIGISFASCLGLAGWFAVEKRELQIRVNEGSSED